MAAAAPRRRRPRRPLPPPWSVLLLILLLQALCLLADPAQAAAAAAAPSPSPSPPADANATAAPPPPSFSSFAPELGSASASGVVYGTVQIVAVHGPMVPGTEVEHEHQPFVSVRGSGEMRRLLFPAAQAAQAGRPRESGGGGGHDHHQGAGAPRVPPSGSLVMVKTAPMARCVKPGTPVDGNPVCVQSMMAHECEWLWVLVFSQ
jgi:hypothetical protein